MKGTAVLLLALVAAVAADSVRVVYSVEERKVQQSNNGRPVNSKPERPEPEAEEAIEFLSNGCPANPEIHWLVPDESECSSFYYCVSGTKVLRSCPEGLQFNADIQICDWPENVGCSSDNNNNNNNGPNNNGPNNSNNNNGPSNNNNNGPNNSNNNRPNNNNNNGPNNSNNNRPNNNNNNRPNNNGPSNNRPNNNGSNNNSNNNGPNNNGSNNNNNNNSRPKNF